MRIYKLPWMTFILVATILVWSFQSFDQVDTIETRYLRSEHLLRILESKVKMLASICESEGSLGKTSCEAVKKVSKEPFQNVNQPLQKFVSELPKSAFSEKETTVFQNIIFGEKFFKKNEDKLSNSEAFRQWKTEQSLFDEELNEHNRASGLLSKANWNFKTLTKAQFIHGGYIHLIGNLLFFIFLSVFVELRVGAFMYLVVFLAGGYAGLSAHLLFTSSAAITLMGASANISGIA
ncbi:MAG: rhomboid family intramembrane serine protease, partial [Pseudobdellovibrionaceae bacterium]